jgi:predicted nucleic acid-binding protein
VSRLVVTDTSCLIALDRVGVLSLLPQLYDDVVAPPAVIAEFGRRPDWLREEAVEDRAAVRRLLLRGLDWGEAEAITLARTLPATRLLVDEVRGRKIAVGFGLPVLGTAGLLVVAKDAGLIPAVKPLLDALRDKHEFRLSDRLYADVLAQAGEE